MTIKKKHRTCPVCDMDDNSFQFNNNVSPGLIVSCKNCGMVYVTDIKDDHALIESEPALFDFDKKVLTSSNLEDVKGSWEIEILQSKEREELAIVENSRVALDLIEEYLSSQERDQTHLKILDFGCGYGFTLLAAKEKGWELYGIDPLPVSAIYTRINTGASVITDVLKDDTFPPNSFDIITSFQVFEHLPNPRNDLLNLYKIIKQGGIILVEVPNIDNWSVSVFRGRHRHFTQDHINFFSKSTLKKLLMEAGFEVLDEYNTARIISLGYMVEVWGNRYFPKKMVNIGKSLIKRLNFQDKLVTLNFNDILTVVACKPIIG